MVANEDTIVVIRRNSRLVFKSAHLTAEGSSASRISNTFFRKTNFLLGNPEEFCFLTCFRFSAIFSRTIRLCLSFSKVMNTLVTSYDFLVKYRIFGKKCTKEGSPEQLTPIQCVFQDFSLYNHTFVLSFSIRFRCSGIPLDNR